MDTSRDTTTPSSKGQHEGREHDPYDYQTPDWRQATRGYQTLDGRSQLVPARNQNGYSNGSAPLPECRGWRVIAMARWRSGGFLTVREAMIRISQLVNVCRPSSGLKTEAAVARADCKMASPTTRGARPYR